MKNNKDEDNKDQWYIDNYWSSDDDEDNREPTSGKGLLIACFISLLAWAVVYGAVKLWNVMQRP